MAEPGRNIELKARDTDPQRSLAVCEEIGAKDCGVLRQRDTYFNAVHGRLKLREEEGAPAHLIAYERADVAGERTSHYWLIDVPDPEGLKAALEATLGIKVVVAKERRLFLWETVRIHLDAVTSQGNFIEFEAVAPADSDLSYEKALVAELRQAFNVNESELIDSSYSDLVVAQRTSASPCARLAGRDGEAG